MKRILNPIFLSILITLTGIIILFFSFISKDQTNDYIETTAKFYDYREKITGNNEYILKYKYTVNGKEYEFTQNITSRNKPSLFENDTIKIKYNPNNPRQALLYNENPKLGGIIFGAILIILGIATFIKMKGV